MLKWRGCSRLPVDAVEVHMADVVGGTVDLTEFRGLTACHGFLVWRRALRGRRVGIRGIAAQRGTRCICYALLTRRRRICARRVK